MAKNIEINIASGAEKIGLADMLKELLTQNLEQNPHKIQDFEKLNIGIGLIVIDADVELTMEFSKGVLNLHPGIKGKPEIVITSGVDKIMALSNVKIKGGMPYYFDKTGRDILKAIFTGRLKIKGMITHFASLIRLSRIMSVQ